MKRGREETSTTKASTSTVLGSSEPPKQHQFFAQIGQFVMPGDCIGRIAPNLKIRLGPGLMQEGERIISTKSGILRQRSVNYWLENNQMRYVPLVEDLVVGTVIERHAENYKVDIGSASPAILSTLAFDGATKKNKPTLVVGSLVYARVIVANKDMEPELSCVTIGNRTGFGELKGGNAIKCSLNLARQLNMKQCLVLQLIATYTPYELAVGMNGRVWINSSNHSSTVVISNAILNSEFLTPKQTQAMVDRLFNAGMLKEEEE